MDIIEFLIDYHDHLRKDCAEIHKGLSDPERLNGKIKTFISNFELCETLEEKFLMKKLEALPVGEELTRAEECRKEHAEIWSALGKLHQAIKTKSAHVQTIFFAFSAFAEAHFRNEEGKCFLAVRRLFDQEALEKLGQDAEKYYRRFTCQIQAEEKEVRF